MQYWINYNSLKEGNLSFGESVGSLLFGEEPEAGKVTQLKPTGLSMPRLFPVVL